MSIRLRGLPFEYLQHLFQFGAQLPDDLLALDIVVFNNIPGQLLSGTPDGETLFIEQTAYLADHDHVVALVVSAVAAALHRLELDKLLLPIAEYVGFDPAEFAYFTDREIALAWDRWQIQRTTVRFQHKLPP